MSKNKKINKDQIDLMKINLTNLFTHIINPLPTYEIYIVEESNVIVKNFESGF